MSHQNPKGLHVGSSVKGKWGGARLDIQTAEANSKERSICCAESYLSSVSATLPPLVKILNFSSAAQAVLKKP